MNKKIKRRIQKGIAVVLFVFGLVTLPLPFVPGVVFIALSLYIFSLHSPRTKERVMQVRRRVWVLDRSCMYIERYVLLKKKRSGVPSEEEV